MSMDGGWRIIIFLLVFPSLASQQCRNCVFECTWANALRNGLAVCEIAQRKIEVNFRNTRVNEQRIDFSLGLLRAGSLTPVPLYSTLSSNNYHWLGLLFTLWFSSPRLFVCSSAGISSGFIEGTLRYGPGSNENITVPMPRSSSSAFWHSASTWHINSYYAIRYRAGALMDPQVSSGILQPTKPHHCFSYCYCCIQRHVYLFYI